MNENNFPSCGVEYFNGPAAPVIDHNGRVVGQTVCTQHKDADAPVIWFRPLHAGEWGHWREIDPPATNAVTQAGKAVAWRVVSADGRIRTTYYEAPDEVRLAAAKMDGDTIVPMFDHAAPQASEAVRDALIPFAAMEEVDLIGTAYEGKGDDAEILHFYRTGKSVTLGDFRRARTALSAQPGAQKSGPTSE